MASFIFLITYIQIQAILKREPAIFVCVSKNFFQINCRHTKTHINFGQHIFNLFLYFFIT